MAKTKLIRVTVPDDFEAPDRLVQTAIERYLYWNERWRLVQIENAERAPTEKVLIPIPRLAPFGLALVNPETVQEVWDAFVKPDQDSGILQSVEMRSLMAILRAIHQGLVDANLDLSDIEETP